MPGAELVTCRRTCFGGLRRAAIEAEREELERIREERSIPGDTLRELERELDLVEARLGVGSRT